MSGQTVLIYKPAAAKAFLTEWLKDENDKTEVLLAKMREAKEMADAAQKEEANLREKYSSALYDPKHPKHSESKAAFDLYIKHSKIQFEAEGELQEIIDCRDLLAAAPRPDYTTQTNADGRFKIRLPREQVVLMTQGFWRGKPAVWCVLVTPEAGDRMELILSGQNRARMGFIEEMNRNL